MFHFIQLWIPSHIMNYLQSNFATKKYVFKLLPFYWDKIFQNVFNFRKLQEQYDEFEKLREEEKIAALEKLKQYNDARS